MTRKEGTLMISQLKMLLSAVVCAAVVTMAAILCTAVMMERGVLKVGEYDGLYARLGLTLGSLSSASYICLRADRKKLLLASGSTTLALAIVLCFSALCRAGEFNYFDLVTDIVVSLVPAWLICLVATKRTKVRKVKKVHK